MISGRTAEPQSDDCNRLHCVAAAHRKQSQQFPARIERQRISKHSLGTAYGWRRGARVARSALLGVASGLGAAARAEVVSLLAERRGGALLHRASLVAAQVDGLDLCRDLGKVSSLQKEEKSAMRSVRDPGSILTALSSTRLSVMERMSCTSWSIMSSDRLCVGCLARKHNER